MDWNQAYGADRQPDEGDIERFIDSPLWPQLNAFLREGYDTAPIYSYSTCSGQPGWNVKYQKAGRSLCTLYPMPGYFIALVVIGARERTEVDLLMPACSAYVRDVYANADGMAGAKWLMIGVTDQRILADVELLIQARRRIKPQKASG